MSVDDAGKIAQRPSGAERPDPDVALAARLLGGRALAVAWGGRVRVVVPAGGALRRARGVRSAQAYRPRARAWRWLVAARTALGPGTPLDAPDPLAPRTWLPSGQRHLVPRAVLVGTPGPERSLVAILTDAQGRDRAVAKVAVGPGVAEGLRREEAALRDPAVAGHAPELQAVFELDGRPALLTTHLTGRPLRSREWERLAPVLAPERGAREVDPAELPLIVAAARAAGLAPGRAADALGPAVPAVRTHGDLAPWNVLLGPHGPVLIDWEESRSDGVPGLDLAHFLLSAGVLLRDVPPSSAARAAATRLAAAGWPPAAADALVALAAGDRLRRGVRDGHEEAALAPWQDAVAATRLGSAAAGG